VQPDKDIKNEQENYISISMANKGTETLSTVLQTQFSNTLKQ
jgi:hypothetical protein